MGDVGYGSIFSNLRNRRLEPMLSNHPTIGGPNFHHPVIVSSMSLEASTFGMLETVGFTEFIEHRESTHRQMEKIYGIDEEKLRIYLIISHQ